MARIELPPGCRPHPGWTPPQEPPKYRFYFDQFCSSLISMKGTGQHFGSKAFHFLSRLFSTLTAATKKKREPAPPAPPRLVPGKREASSLNHKKKMFSLTNPSEFLQIFEKRPAKSINKLLDFLLNKPDTARKILLNLVRHWKEFPQAFVQYDKSKDKRAAMRSVLNELFKQNILTREQLQLQARIVKVDFTEAEAQIMSGEMVTTMTPELEQFQRDFQALQKPEVMGQTLWDSVYAFLEHKNELEDLMFIDGEERSFDRVIEAMFYYRSFTSLRSADAYASNQKLLLNLLAHLQGSGVLGHYPKVKLLVDKAHALLSDETKARELKGILLEVLEIADPLSKSPPRRT